IDVLLVDSVGVLGGNLFDLHASGLRGHEDELCLRTIEDNAEVELTVDRRGLFDEQPLHLLALRASLVRDQLHAENLLRVLLGFGEVLRYLDTAALAAAAGVDLRLDDDAF